VTWHLLPRKVLLAISAVAILAFIWALAFAGESQSYDEDVPFDEVISQSFDDEAPELSDEEKLDEIIESMDLGNCSFLESKAYVAICGAGAAAATKPPAHWAGRALAALAVLGGCDVVEWCTCNPGGWKECIAPGPMPDCGEHGYEQTFWAEGAWG